MTTTVALPADVAEALAREQGYLDSRPRGGKGGKDFDFDNLEAPPATQVGQSLIHHRAFLPRAIPMVGLPWFGVPNHSVMAQGNQTIVTCPHRYALLNDPNGSQGAPPPCPLCEAADFVKESARNFPRDSPENKETWEKGMRLGARERYFANTVDLDNPSRHWKTDEAGATNIIPTLSAFGTEVRDGLKAVMGECGMFWHPQALTRIKVTATRTGKLDFNVERDVRMTLPVGGCQLPEGTLPYFLNNLNDLTSLVKLHSYEALKSFIPSYARPNAQVQVPASPYAQPAPTQALPPPIPQVPPLPGVPMTAAAAPPPMPALPMAPPAAAAPPAMPPMPSLPPMPGAATAAAPPPPMPMVPAAAAAPPAGPPPMPALPPMPTVPTAAVAQPAAPPPSPSSPPSMPPMPALPPMPRI